MGVGDSARKHGVADADILHAIDHALALGDPDRWLVVGPDHAGNLLEVVVMVTAEGTQLADPRDGDALALSETSRS